MCCPGGERHWGVKEGGKEVRGGRYRLFGGGEMSNRRGGGGLGCRRMVLKRTFQ